MQQVDNAEVPKPRPTPDNVTTATRCTWMQLPHPGKALNQATPNHATTRARGV